MERGSGWWVLKLSRIWIIFYTGNLGNLNLALLNRTSMEAAVFQVGLLPPLILILLCTPKL